ncbi:MAG: site-specific DNA-methyltransferase [Mycoplasma sp.]|nr:site-specific DNA-methyltransferase [Mycoplasma sp.]
MVGLNFKKYSRGGIKFDYPKPTTLITKLINTHPKKQLTILDFFAGTSTTGHAVWQINKTQNTNHKFILVSNNENNIFDNFTYPRLEKIHNSYDENLSVFKINNLEINTKFHDDYALLISSHLTEIIKLKENIYSKNISLKNDFEKFTSKTKAIYIYKDFYNQGILDKISQDINNSNFKTNKVYLFSLGNDLPYELLKTNKNINVSLEAIPLEYLNKIKLNKQEIQND